MNIDERLGTDTTDKEKSAPGVLTHRDYLQYHPATERGAAGIIITLQEGTITISHAEEGTVLSVWEAAPEGTWGLLWDSLYELGFPDPRAVKAE